MKTLIVVALLMLSLGSHAILNSGFGKVSPLPEDFDVYCESDNGGAAIVIVLPKSGKSGGVWQTDPGDTEGLELTKLRFTKGTCQKCFNFEGVLIEDLVMQGKLKEESLDYSVKGRADQGITLSCQWTN